MRFGIVRFPGSCDEIDAVGACARFGEAELLWHGERTVRGVDAVVVPGGFSYGDHLRVGAIARFSPVMDAVGDFIRDGGLVLGICNGFQVLCEAGHLPGALLPNAGLRFVCRQVALRVERTDTAFTSLCPPGELLQVPVKHASGRYWAPDADLREMEANGQVAMRYEPDDNPNGSVDHIAGVISAEGNVLGLMPHPEHAVDPLSGSADGGLLFASMAAALERVAA
jgi:phosphoribosylformylglycinamidine synthase